MSVRSLGAALLLTATALVAVAATYTDSQLRAKFYYDLGPDAVDVDKYPAAIRAGHQTFIAVCAGCHTLARPLNSPITSRGDWLRFIRKMHLQTKAAPGTNFSALEAKSIVDFLVYDSKIRKLDGRRAFAAMTEGLKADFRNVQAERARLQLERDAKAARPYDDHAGATPHPQ